MSERQAQIIEDLRIQLASVQAERDAAQTKLDDIAEILRRVGHHPEAHKWGSVWKDAATDLAVGVEALIATKESSEYQLVQALGRERLLRDALDALTTFLENGMGDYANVFANLPDEHLEALRDALGVASSALLTPAPAAEGRTK